MSVEAPSHSYFVGRRVFEAAEVYAVTATDVERLRRDRRASGPDLDWHGSKPSRMELSRVLINRVAKARPSRELQARFATYVLDRFPDDGFVLDADDVRRWLRLASVPEDFVGSDHSAASWGARLRTLLHLTTTERAHA
jgi:hypothetical protein